MSLSPSQLAALQATGASFTLDAPLARRTWWRVGGPADALVEVPSLQILQAVQRVAHETGLPVFPLGNGSNLLVSDAGVRGLVIQLKGEFLESKASEGTLHVGAGLRLAVLLARAARHQWPGLEALAGIPGTVGGAVRMNAGTSLGEIGDRIISIDIVDATGQLATLTADDLKLAYRHALLPKGAVIARARLQLCGDYAESAQRAATFLARRKATQPLDYPSCGSTFRNPPSDAAGRLIDAAGLKGTKIGGAMVSEKHANFLLNMGQATAEDIRALIEHVRDRVHAHSGILLDPEVKLAGEWRRDGW